MKKNILILILGCVLFFSCSDFLDKERVSFPKEYSETLGGDTNIISASVADNKIKSLVYIFIDEEEVTGRGFMWLINASDDMVTGRDKAHADNVKNFIRNDGNGSTQNWGKMYELINACNENIKMLKSKNQNNANVQKLLGASYFYRAWAYLWLAPHYGDNGYNGGLPIVTEKDTDPDVVRASTVCSNYEMCIEDLDKAAELLPYFDELDKTQYGLTPHKTACWAYAAKAALYNSQFKTDYLSKVVEYCDKVIYSRRHDLVKNYADVFKMANNWSSEYIWSFPSLDNYSMGSKLPGVMLENKGWGLYNGWGYYMPTYELYSEFESGDKRLKTTILAPGDSFNFLGTEKVYQTSASKSGMQFNKYMEPFSYTNSIGTFVDPNGDHGVTLLNVPLIRYAEVLLWKSEALISLGENGDYTLNLVRTRAGLPAKTNATLADLKHERRCELAGEWSDRHFDLVRWGDAQATYAKTLHGFKQGITSPTAENVVEIWPARTFDPQKNQVWWIPQDELNKRTKLVQNKGW